FAIMIPPPPRPTLFPYTTLFRSKKAVNLAPQEGNNWNTLGVAHYRAGDPKAAIAALEKSDELLKGNDLSFNAFFLAMTQWQLGRSEEHTSELQSLAYLVCRLLLE